MCWASAQSLETSVPSQREWGRDYGQHAHYGTGTARDRVVPQQYAGEDLIAINSISLFPSIVVFAKKPCLLIMCLK